MSQYDNTGRGALFKNDQKASDKHPDYKGQANVDGVDCWVDAWIKTAESGRKYMSLSIKPKDLRQAAPAAKPAPKRNAYAEAKGRPQRDMDDDGPPF